MRLICLSLLVFSLTLVALQPAFGGAKPPQIMLRVYIQTAGEGLASTQATSVALPPNGEIIQVRAMPEVTEHDLVEVKTGPEGNVFLIFNHVGKVNLDAATGENQGRILVVMLNGVVIYAPVVDEQITNGVLEIPHPLPPQVITALQDMTKLNNKDAPPPPRPVY